MRRLVFLSITFALNFFVMFFLAIYLVDIRGNYWGLIIILLCGANSWFLTETAQTIDRLKRARILK